MDIKEPRGQIVEPQINARWQVRAFAEEMERVLRANDCKGGWSDCQVSYLQHRLVEEMGEYFRSLEMNVQPTWRQRELVDIANFCMMLWDRTK